MNDKVRLACGQEVIMVPLGKILPTRLLDDGIRKTVKFKCIEASVKELGLIEPLVVFPQPNSQGCYMLLDGHVRYLILKDLEHSAAKCLVATDDEGYTYNHKLSGMTAVQEHFMVLKAIKSGVSETNIAKSLNLNIAVIKQKRDLLEGICPEAVGLLKDSRATGQAFRELRKLKPMRQIAVAELLRAAGNYSVGYVKYLVMATPEDQMLEVARGKDSHRLSPEDISRMEHEMESLGREFKLIEESHGKNTLNLVLVNGYLKKLLDNARILRFLSQNYPEILAELNKSVEMKSLADNNAA